MDLISKRKLITTFLIKGKHCIVVPSVTHRALRIFHDNNVYDIMLTDNEFKTWTTSGNENRRTYIKKIMEETLLDAKSTEKNASIYDGYLA